MLYLSRIKKFLTKSGGIVTPGTSQKIACEEGRYTTGTIYVAGDSNLNSENIKSGVSIFGVSGTLKGLEYYSGSIVFPRYNVQCYYTDKNGFQEETGRNTTKNIDVLKNTMIYININTLPMYPSLTNCDLVERVEWGSMVMGYVIRPTANNFKISMIDA